MLTVWLPAAISSQPASRTNVLGTTATFSVTAAGTEPLSYQWRFNGAAIEGATTNLYSLGSVQSSNAGSYDVVVTNVVNSVTSQVGVLTVWLLSLKTLTLEFVEGNQLQLWVGTNNGTAIDSNQLAKLEIRFTTNLVHALGGWPKLTNSLVLTNGRVRVDNVNSGAGPRRYFIAVEQP